MTTRKTCDKCDHYRPPAPEMVAILPEDVNDGECAMMVDANDVDVHEPDRCYGLNYEGNRADVHVGPKFGCIHWEKKSSTGSPGEPLGHDTENLTKE